MVSFDSSASGGKQSDENVFVLQMNNPKYDSYFH